MDLEIIWEKFLSSLNQEPKINNAYYKKVAGIPFLYLSVMEGTDGDYIGKAIRLHSASAMKGKQLHSETFFVRNNEGLFVYRHRFFVPLRKMFCCGNLCTDCIRLETQSITEQ
ncbi:hypothetical protein [Mesobacillus zeae]|uniref:Uncharacterized protein n=1 Tax=Mesobacillus zeae TaxID=1917180 RepID=A0A398BF44_9BACI|nr:hypothetical protein [Mesobacillus zeae]RID87881.1 hypothetical protein D1970_03330 [Mesobacillus zeae]